MTALEMFEAVINTVTSVMKFKARRYYMIYAGVVVATVIAVILVLTR